MGTTMEMASSAKEWMAYEWVFGRGNNENRAQRIDWRMARFLDSDPNELEKELI